MAEKLIKFVAKDPFTWEVVNRPFPAVQALPDWWRKMTPFHQNENNPDGNKFNLEDYVSNASPKKCVPMLDAFNAGYIMPLWADVQVKSDVEYDKVGYLPRITWRTSRPVFAIHGDTRGLETPDGFHWQAFKFSSWWRIVTPPGYSVLITQPFGYKNEAFHAVTGIADTDKLETEIASPVWVRTGIDEIIKAGTPMIQIIPFKRDDWRAEYEMMKEGEYEIMDNLNLGKNILHNYVKNIWSKKRFR
jgi:hypothetical protein